MFAASQHRKPGFWTSVFTVVLLATLVRVWVWPIPTLPQARAQLPDSGMQRKLLLEETRRTNELLGEIKQILTSHILNVRIEGADNQAHPRSKRRGEGG